MRGLRKERNALIATLRQLERESEARSMAAKQRTPTKASPADADSLVYTPRGGSGPTTPVESPARRPLAARMTAVESSPKRSPKLLGVESRLDRLAATVDSLLRE